MGSPKRLKTHLFTVVFLVIGVISYLLADRYLIEHVEMTNVSAYAASIEAIKTEEVYPTSTITLEATALPAVLNEVAETPAASDAVVFDDWNYQSSTVSVAITRQVIGSGNNTLTYFVADVVISDATRLASAFADNQFGRNIIEYTSEIARENNAIFAINGDYYGFRSDGIEIRNGVIYRDEPARTGLVFYLDGSMKIYDETQTSAQKLLDGGAWNTLSFGPALVEDSLVVNNLGKVEIDTNFGNHSIQGNQPRTGIGIIAPNHFIFIVVDGRSTGYSRGANLTEFAEIFKDLGCTDAYNIDGGGSSTMYFMGRVVNNPLGKNRERGTSDILFIAS